MRKFLRPKVRTLALLLLLPALALGPIGCSPQAEKATGTVLMTLGSVALPAEPTTGSALLGAGGTLLIHGAHREGQETSQGNE